MICESANSPISAGIKSTPPVKLEKPAVRRTVPVIESIPIKEIRTPTKPPTIPFIIELSDMEAIIVRPKTPREKYSIALNLRATLAINGDIRARTVTLIIPPIMDATIQSPNALPGSPFWAIGNASNVVATEEGVPGIFNNAAGMDPPEIAPQ
ncbi:hypothetical protein GCM10008094_03680 [Aidingimonas halophila]|nr:hypothetical protein GCM10008094_03680 [Aidingimonas halophila]